MRGICWVVALTTGCSFMFVDGPPRHHAQLPAFECTTSRTTPVIDTIITGLQAANFLMAATKSDAEWDRDFDGDPPFSRNVAMGTYGAFTAIGAAAMIYGYATVGACKDAKAALHQRAMAPGPWVAP